MAFACPATDDFFRSRIDHMIDLRLPLAVLASRMPWQEIEARVAQVFSHKGRAGVAMPDLDLFGEQVQRAAVSSNAARPRVPLRIMIALLYLKHAFNDSDEGVVARWADTPRWQFFSGCAYYEDRQPRDGTTLVKFRQLLGEEGVEELLAQTINVAIELKLIKPQELSRVIVDSTVQHKAIAHPTDSRLLETARLNLVQAAKETGIDLKQTFAKEGREPVICIDEKSLQLIGHSRAPLPMNSRSPEKVDYEYARNGTTNLFVAVEPKAGQRTVSVTERRGKADFVVFVGDLLTHTYAKARRVHLVLDNLNIHFRRCFDDVLGKRAANKLLRRVQFHYTPKHASWLNWRRSRSVRKQTVEPVFGIIKRVMGWQQMSMRGLRKAQGEWH